MALPDLRDCIRRADIVLGIDPESGEQVVFYGRDRLERIVQTGAAERVAVVTFGVNLDSAQNQKLSTEILALKGSVTYSPADRFPEVVTDLTNLPREHHAGFKQVVEEVRSEHMSLLPPAQQTFFHIARESGFPGAVGVTQSLAEQTNQPRAFPVIALSLGEVIQGRLPPDWVVPYRCLDVLFGQPADNQITVRFRSLLTHQAGGSRSYYSHREPKLACGVDGAARVVSFSRHALERICGRTVGDWRTFSGSGDAFAFVDNCAYYEDCTNPEMGLCFTLYDRCAEGFVSYRFLAEILDSFDPRKKYYYRVGYCPAVIEGNFIKAKTLLVPGMRRTPERGLVEALPASERVALENKIESQLTWADKAASPDLQLFKWFHDRGVPQVMAFDHDIFQYD
ncbi:MAG TPA: hypothetical protein VF538_13615 [Pyrinomonadaceae bacterium]